MWASTLKRNALKAWSAGWDGCRSMGDGEGEDATVMVASARGSAMPLEGRDPYHVAENGQKLVHGRSPLRRIRLPLAFLLKRV
jgi:hypothetical protein